MKTTSPRPSLCCIGHITRDHVVTPSFSAFMPGGTAYYFAKALRNIDHKGFRLVTSVSETDSGGVEDLRKEGLDVELIPSQETLFFENRYGDDMDHRVQKVLAKGDPFTPESLRDQEAEIFHLGTLLADDFSLETLRSLAARGRVSVDVQGYLRAVRGEDVEAVDYTDKLEALPYIDILKANEHEMESLTGSSDPEEAARILAGWGVKEVVLTLGSKGSVIFYEGKFSHIPAYPPEALVDATGCGDTYMAGYLYRRSKGDEPLEAGKYAAAMCSIKLAGKGPFQGSDADIRALMAMHIPPIINYFTDDDLYKFTMACAVIDNFPRTQVRYRFNDRDHTVYPKGFAEALSRQISLLENLRITDEEIAFMRRRCNYIPDWFHSFLKGFRYHREWVSVEQDEEGHLDIWFEGCWSNTILLEVKVLAIVSELYYIMTGEAFNLDYTSFEERTEAKGRRMIEAGAAFCDMGTRRRASFKSQDIAVRALKRAGETTPGKGRFIGTSNVYLAMKYDLTPIGTMAHEFICAIAGMYGPQMANHLAMESWSQTYRGALGTFLYDTYGWRIFSLNFSEDYANLFKGLRVDSGDNFEQLDLIVEKYRSLNIDPSSKQVIFSNGLNIDEVVKILKYSEGKCLPSFGIGTHFTNDFPGVRPRNIVIKLLAVKITESWPFYCDTCKLSEDKGKYTGDPKTVRRFMEALHLD